MTAQTTAASRARTSRGFTLIEVLVVVAIIALLISILLPSLKAARQQARTVTCATGLRTIMQSVTLYTNDFKDTMPTGALFDRNGNVVNDVVNSNMWEFLYPYVQKKSIRKTGSSQVPYEVRLELFTCPDDPAQHTSNQRTITLPDGTQIQPMIYLSYFANKHVVVNFSGKKQMAQKLSRMKNQSRMVAMNDGGDDVGDGGGPWYLLDCMSASPPNNQCAIELRHKTGNNFVFLDGHVDFHKFINKGPQYGLPVYPFMWNPDYKSPGSLDNYVRQEPQKTAPPT